MKMLTKLYDILLANGVICSENLFMDNEDECKYLLSKEGKKSIIDLHVDGIISYISKKSI